MILILCLHLYFLQISDLIIDINEAGYFEHRNNRFFCAQFLLSILFNNLKKVTPAGKPGPLLYE